jgi:signal peptidase II
MTPKLKIFLGLFAATLLLDQGTKSLIVSSIAYGGQVEVIKGFFYLTHVGNPGAAFSFLADQPAWFRQPFFIGATSVAVFIIISFYRKLAPHERLSAFALGAILGGAVGNLIDRIFRSGSCGEATRGPTSISPTPSSCPAWACSSSSCSPPRVRAAPIRCAPAPRLPPMQRSRVARLLHHSLGFEIARAPCVSRTSSTVGANTILTLAWGSAIEASAVAPTEFRRSSHFTSPATLGASLKSFTSIEDATGMRGAGATGSTFAAAPGGVHGSGRSAS